MSLNCLVFHTSEGISISPAVFLFLIFHSIESSSSCVNCPSLISNCLVIFLVIGSCITFGGFLSKFLKCCLHSCIRSSWLVAFILAFTVLPSAYFVYHLLCYLRLSIFNQISNLINLILYVFCLFF